MIVFNDKRVRSLVLLSACGVFVACSKSEVASKSAPADHDSALATQGSIEVTAQLLEIPEKAIFKRELYDYATVLKYKVIDVHRGKVDGKTIYVGHYNPFKPRSLAADRRVPRIGGDLKTFRPGQVHRMDLEVPMDDYFMGGVVDQYFGQDKGPIYWAVRTDLISE